MNWNDLLKMSSESLRRRKFRSFLTILGVIVGTASIVVMVSLTMGQQRILEKELKEKGGMTAITITMPQTTGKSTGNGKTDKKKKARYLTDDVVQECKGLAHVQAAYGTISSRAILISGNKEAYVTICGLSEEALKHRNFGLQGTDRLPQNGGKAFEVFYGKGVDGAFYDKNAEPVVDEVSGTEQYYSAHVDYRKEQVFLILNQERYEEQNTAYEDQAISEDSGSGENEGEVSSREPLRKYCLQCVGAQSGNFSVFGEGNEIMVYCTIDQLKQALKETYGSQAIPGQPVTQTGKPLSFLTYTDITVEVDDVEHVDMVVKTLKSQGYTVQTNRGVLDSAKETISIFANLLGGIGAVSMVVAAIGITNTMMMTIYERTKEIGVMKVLGCNLKNIRRMFLLEAAFIGLLGGILGNLLSLAISLIGNLFVPGISYIPPWLMLVSAGFATVIATAAGVTPAIRATKLSPLAAIQTE